MVDETIEQSNDEISSESDDSNQEIKEETTTDAPEPAEEVVAGEDSEAKEGSNIYDNKVFREEAEKIRESTKHKESRKYKKDLETKELQIQELESRINTLSTPPDDESIFDKRLGQWRPQNISVDEYSTLLEKHETDKRQQEQMTEAVRPLEERVNKAVEANPEIEANLTAAMQNRVIDEAILLDAARDDGSIEMLSDLVKSNSPKLGEIMRLPIQDRRVAIRELVLAKRYSTPDVKTSADTPLKPESESATVETNYEAMTYNDGYKEFLKRKGQRS